MRERLERGEQSLLFLNRRGYAPLTLCRHCGYRFQCPNCSAWLVEHRLSRRLSCHHCGHEVPVPDECPDCHTGDCLVACGPGVERIADEVKELFPQARTALAAGNRDAFYAAEAEARREAGAPPFGRWAAIIVSSEDEAEAREAARAIGGTRPHLPDVLVLGPALAPLALLRGRYRYRLLINARRSAQLQDVIRQWLASLSSPQGVRIGVDIDPYSFV